MSGVIDDSAETIPSLPVDRNDLPGSCPTLDVDEVHVWQAHLDDHAASTFQSLLAEAETSRAARFHFAKDRDHYIVARGLLRELLGGYLSIDPAEIRLEYGQKGKPELAEAQGSLLKFNLAHSKGRVIFAFSLGRGIGVDIEFIREDFATDEIAERFFSAAEIRALAAVPRELKQQAFFDCWTRKEAYLKARGDGLSMPLDEFDVSFAPGETAALLRNHKEPTEVSRWTMRSISAPAGYAAAVVVEGDGWRLKTFEL